MDNIVNFSKIGRIILKNITKKYTHNDFKKLLCSRACRTEYDRSNFSNWLSGKKNPADEVSQYYKNQKNTAQLAVDIAGELLPAVSDLPKLMEELKSVVRQDASITAKKRSELLTGENDAEEIANILRFAIMRRVKGGVSGSPALEGQFLNAKMPKPIKKLIGREAELVELSERLEMCSTLFITGVSGIGKRELAKQYAETYRKSYVNRLFLPFHGSIQETVADMQHIDDQPEESMEQRFGRHSRLLRSLKADSLLVIEGLDRLPELDADFALLSELNCHVLVTTTLEMRKENTLFLQPLQAKNDVLKLFYLKEPTRKMQHQTA